MKRIIIIASIALLTGCAGPTKAGKEARASAHKRMDIVNAGLAAQQAKQQFEVGELETSIETIDAAIARLGENSSYHLLRGRILIEQHKLDAAHKSLTRSVELSPEVAEPHYFLGILYQRWSEDKEALASYKKAMECDPTHLQYLLAASESHVALNQLDEAIEMLRGVGKEFKHHPSVSSLLGHIYLRKGCADEATKYLSDSLLLGDDDASTLTLLVTSQFLAGKYADCLLSIARLQELNPTLPFNIQRLQGKCFSSTGRKIKGRDICLMVARETPDDAEAWIDLGYIAWDMGDYNRVAVCGEKILQLNPELSEGPLFLGISEIRSGNSHQGLELLAKAQSDNTIDGLDLLVQSYAKRAKLRAKRPITPNVTTKIVEGDAEQHSQKLAEGSQPIVGVTQDSPLAP